MNPWGFLKRLFQRGNNKDAGEKAVTRLVNLAFSQLQGGNYVEAQELLLKALEYKSEMQNSVLLDWILTSLSKTWEETEEYQKWTEFFSAFIARNPNQAVAYHLRAESHWYAGSLSDAITDYSRAVELNPKDVSAFLGRGQVFMECRDFSRALEDLDTALDSIDSLPGADAAWKVEFEAFATPYPQPSQTVTGTNLAISACTSPVVLGIGTNVDLFTDYSIHMTITVWDQFMTSVGDLYAGAAISETSGGTVYPINQTLTSSSTYTDPFGPGYVSASNVSPSDPRVAAWPSQPLGPFPIATQTPTTPVQVDGFSIGTISTRTWTSTSPNTVTITWPD
jgi:hypothetical protein